MNKCTHVNQIQDVKTPYEKAARNVSRWATAGFICGLCMNLRACRLLRFLEENKHATKHFHHTKHPIMKSLEPGEFWGWCFRRRSGNWSLIV